LKKTEGLLFFYPGVQTAYLFVSNIFVICVPSKDEEKETNPHAKYD